MEPNVLLVVLDAVQAKNTSLHGHENDTTPFLRELGDRATVYEQARAPSFWSLPSHASMFTGLEVAEHGLTSFFDRLDPGHTVWERLRDERGYETAAFTQNPHVTQPDFGLDAGFTTIVSDPTPGRFISDAGGTPGEADLSGSGIDRYVSYLRYCLEHDRPVRSAWNGGVEELISRLPERFAAVVDPPAGAPEYAEAFLEWESERDGPWAACLNFMDAHQPMRPDPEHDRWGGERAQRIHDDLGDIGWDFYVGRKPWWQRKAIESLYDGCIRQMDATLESLFEELAARGELSDTLVVVTSDHGDGFGEVSRVRSGFRVCDHNGGVHEVLYHVPLVVKYPGQEDGLVVDEPATLTRFPTAVERAIRGDWEGSEFVPERRVVASADHDGLYADGTQRMTRYAETIDVSSFSGLGRIVYEREDDRIKKYVEWGTDAATIAIRDANNAMRVADERDPREVVADAFADFEERPVKADDVELTESAHRKLRELGYVE